MIPLVTSLSAMLLLGDCQRIAEPAERTAQSYCYSRRECGVVVRHVPRRHHAPVRGLRHPHRRFRQSRRSCECHPARRHRQAALGQEGVPVAAWRAFANKPFWCVRLEGETLVFSTPENQAGTAMQARHMPLLVGT